METDLAEKAKEAFVDDDFETAVDFYTQAISLNPRNADLFADRAQANIKLKNFTGNTNLLSLSLSLSICSNSRDRMYVTSCNMKFMLVTVGLCIMSILGHLQSFIKFKFDGKRLKGCSNLFMKLV